MIYSLESAAERLASFDTLLAKYGIRYDKTSVFYKSAYHILEMLEAHKRTIEINEHEDLRPLFREALGLNDFIAKILNVQTHRNFDRLVPHLKKITKGSPVLTVSATNKDLLDKNDRKPLDDSNKLFELYLACLALPEFDNLVLDDPDNAKGDNPDLLFDAFGKKWAIAAKVLHTETIKLESIYKNWDKGSDQIEKCVANKGIVFISLRNLIEYNDVWPIVNDKEVEQGGIRYYAAFQDIAIPTQILEGYGLAIRKGMLDEFGETPIHSINSRPSSVGGFVVACQSATGVLFDLNPMPAILKVFTGVQFAPFDDEVLGVLCRLNHQMQITN